MKKVLIDSSTWVSYFLGLKRNTPVVQKVNQIISNTDILLIPEMIYVEVLNVLKRLGQGEDSIMEVKTVFAAKKCLKYIHHYDFWFKNLEFYMDRVKLTTQDLVILASVLDFWPCDIITGDKKLHQSYDFLKNTYGENEN